MFKKNVAITGFPVAMINKGNGSAVTTGTVTGYVVKDGGTQAPLAGTCTHKGNGQWTVDITADEMNANVVGLLFAHTDAVPVNFTITTETDASGAGLFPYYVYENDGVTPIQGAHVWVTTDTAGTNTIADGYTNTQGYVNFDLLAGTYYFWTQKNGWNFTCPDTEVVS